MNYSAFVSMPFGSNPDSPDNEWWKLYEYGIKPLSRRIENDPKFIPIQLYRADRDLEALELKNNVKRLIEKASFLIVVLTAKKSKEGGKESELRIFNPNVLWELGYAESLGKPIVVMADRPDVKKLPILAGTPNVCIYNHNLVRAASPQDAEKSLFEIASRLISYVKEACKEARLVHKNKSSERVFARRSDIDLPKMIAEAEHVVDILTTNVSYFVSSSFHEGKEEEHPFSLALRRNVTVRIATLDPECVIAEYRAAQLHKKDDVPRYREELRDGILKLYRMFGDQENFFLMLYNDLPLQITYRIDSTIFTSIVTRGDRARKRIQVKFDLYEKGVTESFISHFQSVFGTSNDVRGYAWVQRGSR